MFVGYPPLLLKGCYFFLSMLYSLTETGGIIMEPVFSNACKYTLDTLTETERASVSTGYKAYCAISAAVFAALTAFFAYQGQFPAAAVLAVLAILMAAMIFIKASVAAKKSYEASISKYGREYETRLFFYDEKIIGKNIVTGKAFETDYGRIKAVIEAKRLYVLKTDINMSVVADKNGFITDNGSEFIGFLRKKCPLAKIRLISEGK